MEESQKWEHWAIVEVMGHRVFAGFVREEQVAGSGFIRIDVPEIPSLIDEERRPAFSKLFSPGAIYAITPCTQVVATEAANQYRERPYQVFELPMLPRQSDFDDEPY